MWGFAMAGAIELRDDYGGSTQTRPRSSARHTRRRGCPSYSFHAVCEPIPKRCHVAVGPGVEPSDLPIDVVMQARYVDEVTRRDGVWRIHDRVTVFEGRYFLATDDVALDPAWTVGRRASDYTLYVARRRLGIASD